MYNKFLNQINTFYSARRDIFFFLFFFLFYLTFGFFLMGFNNSYLHYRDLVLYADHSRVYHEMVTTVGTHYLTFSHPFFALISQSLVAFIKLFVHSTRFSIILFFTFCASSSIFLLKKCIEKITDNLNSALIISIIYGFSFSTLVFGTMPETYIVSSLTNLLCIYYIIHLIKSDVKELTNKNLITLIALGLLNFGILFANAFLDIIYFIFLLITIYKTNIKKIIIDLVKVVGLFIIFGTCLALFQRFAFPSHDLIFIHRWFPLPYSERITYKYDFSQLLWIIKCHYFNGFYGFNLVTSSRLRLDDLGRLNILILAYKHAGFLKLFPALLFYGLIAFNFLKNYKRISETLNLKFIYLLLFTLGFNLLIGPFYWSFESFLFGQTTLILILLLCGIILSYSKDRFSKWICSFLILVELIQNTRVFKNIIYNILAFYNTQNSYNVFLPILYSIITCFIFLILYFIFRKLINKDILNTTLENKFFITLFLFFGYMILFISFNAMFHRYEECFEYVGF